MAFTSRIIRKALKIVKETVLNSDSAGLNLTAENATSFQTTLDAGTPTAARIVTLPDATGTVTLNDATQSLSNKELQDSSVAFVDQGDTTKKLYLELGNITTGNARVATIPDADFTIVGTDISQTLSNKELIDQSTLIIGDTDPTKKAKFEVDGLTTATMRTISVPDADGTLVLDSATQTLTNKTFTDNTTNFQDNGDNTKKLQFDLNGIAAATTRTLTIPNASGTVVLEDNTATLTNKTIDADAAGNNISNIDNANIKAAAAIDATKIADGSVTSTEFQYLGGVTSDIQTQLNGKIANTFLNAKGDLISASANDTPTIVGVGTDGFVLTADSAETSGIKWSAPSASPTSSTELSNLGLATSVGSSALTIALKQADGSSDPAAGASAVKVGMRSSTLTSGAFNQRSATAATSLVISSGSTLGQTSGQPSNIYVYLLDNAGTLELAASGSLYSENQLISTTAEGGAGAADSRTVVYSTTARTSVPFRLVGIITNTQTTAGTWASAGTVLSVGSFGTLRPKLGPTIQTFTSGSGTYITPSGVSYVKVTVVGGGGGAGVSGADPGGGSGGGGGGGGAVKWITTPDASYSYTVGAGGGSNIAGNSTSFGSSLCEASGGGVGSSPGTSPAGLQGGTGGTGTFGDLLVRGNAGGTGSTSISGVTFGAGGAGGGAAFGLGSGGHGSNGGVGQAGIRGGGGGGSCGGAAAGGAGGTGLIIVEEYYQ